MKQDTKNQFAAIMATQIEAAKSKQKNLTGKINGIDKPKTPAPALSKVTVDQILDTSPPQDATTDTVIAQNKGITISVYSDKAIVVRGNTKPYKDALGHGDLKGIFNFRLKGGSGWIFAKTRQQEVVDWLNAL